MPGFRWQGAGKRIDHLERTLDELGSLDVPVLIGGWGERTLRLAAKRADIIGLTGAPVDSEGKLGSRPQRTSPNGSSTTSTRSAR